MRPLVRCLLLLFLAITIPSRPVLAQPSFETGMIPADHILIPEGDVSANIFLISDGDGWGQDEEKEASELNNAGAIVVGIDLPKYLTALANDTRDCIYMISDVESLAHQIQRSAGTNNYQPPIIAGAGEGGTLALAMIAQSPMATIGEAVAVDPAAGIALAKDLCTPASKNHVGDRTIYGLTDGPLPAGVTVLFSPAARSDGRSHVSSLVADHPDIAVREVGTDAADTLSTILNDRVSSHGKHDEPLGLPITVLDTPPTLDTMAVIYSGDGGWRDIDEQVGAVLQKSGIPVVGVDSLKYFWSQQTAEETASDLSRIIDTYRHRWKVSHVLLAGYSFGADVLPATYNLLPPDDQARVKQLTLLALSRQVDYQISVTGWLGLKGEGAAGDPVDDVTKIDPKRVQCVYGTQEDDDPCPLLKTKGVEAIGIAGGHHFDEDYEALGARIIHSLQARLR